MPERWLEQQLKGNLGDLAGEEKDVGVWLGTAVQGSGTGPRGLWRSRDAQQYGHSNADKRPRASEEVIFCRLGVGRG